MCALLARRSDDDDDNDDDSSGSGSSIGGRGGGRRLEYRLENARAWLILEFRREISAVDLLARLALISGPFPRNVLRFPFFLPLSRRNDTSRSLVRSRSSVRFSGRDVNGKREGARRRVPPSSGIDREGPGFDTRRGVVLSRSLPDLPSCRLSPSTVVSRASVISHTCACHLTIGLQTNLRCARSRAFIRSCLCVISCRYQIVVFLFPPFFFFLHNYLTSPPRSLPIDMFFSNGGQHPIRLMTQYCSAVRIVRVYLREGVVRQWHAPSNVAENHHPHLSVKWHALEEAFLKEG